MWRRTLSAVERRRGRRAFPLVPVRALLAFIRVKILRISSTTEAEPHLPAASGTANRECPRQGNRKEQNRRDNQQKPCKKTAVETRVDENDSSNRNGGDDQRHQPASSPRFHCSPRKQCACARETITGRLNRRPL